MPTSSTPVSLPRAPRLDHRVESRHEASPHVDRNSSLFPIHCRDLCFNDEMDDNRYGDIRAATRRTSTPLNVTSNAAKCVQSLRSARPHGVGGLKNALILQHERAGVTIVFRMFLCIPAHLRIQHIELSVIATVLERGSDQVQHTVPPCTSSI